LAPHKTSLVYFLASSPERPDLDGLEGIKGDRERFILGDGVFYLHAPDGTIAAYADVINRSFVSVSVYGYVHPGFGIGHLLGRLRRAPDARPYAPRPRERPHRRPALRQHGKRGGTATSSISRLHAGARSLRDGDRTPPGSAPTTLAHRHLRAHLRPRKGREGNLRGRRGRLQGHVGTTARHVRTVRQRDGDGELRSFPLIPGHGRRRDSGRHPLQDAGRRGMGQRRRGKVPVAEAWARTRHPPPRPQRGRRKHHRPPDSTDAPPCASERATSYTSKSFAQAWTWA
jgi:hypothetical protein